MKTATSFPRGQKPFEVLFHWRPITWISAIGMAIIDKLGNEYVQYLVLCVGIVKEKGGVHECVGLDSAYRTVRIPRSEPLECSEVTFKVAIDHCKCETALSVLANPIAS
jgi:hypothetical protein